LLPRPRQGAFLKDEARHRIKQQGFVRYRTGIVLAMSLDRRGAGTRAKLASVTKSFSDAPWFRCRHSPDY